MNEALMVKIIVGLIAGAWPVVVGYRTRQLVVGVIGSLLAFGGALLSGFLIAAPVAVGCGWYLERRAAKSARANATLVEEILGSEPDD